MLKVEKLITANDLTDKAGDLLKKALAEEMEANTSHPDLIDQFGIESGTQNEPNMDEAKDYFYKKAEKIVDSLAFYYEFELKY